MAAKVFPRAALFQIVVAAMGCCGCSMQVWLLDIAREFYRSSGISWQRWWLDVAAAMAAGSDETYPRVDPSSVVAIPAAAV